MSNARRIASAREIVHERLPLPAGVDLRPLQMHRDDRGVFTELHRDAWLLGARPVQWNMVRSNANVLRGVHVHRAHLDYLTVAFGELILGLHDLRHTSPTYGLATMLRLEADDLHLAVVPTGVAHGFYFPVPSCHIYAVTIAFDGSDEFGCRWDDPALGLDWPCSAPELSERDRTAGSYSDLVTEFARVVEPAP